MVSSLEHECVLLTLQEDLVKVRCVREDEHARTGKDGKRNVRAVDPFHVVAPGFARKGGRRSV